MRIQGLDVPELKESCRERPGVFPSANTLQELSRQGFLRTLQAQLGLALHRLAAFQQEVPPVPAWGMARSNLHGIRNNIHCLAQLLPGSPEAGAPAQGGPGASPPPPHPPDTFQRKLEGCQFLRGFQRFMHAVEKVFGEWRGALSQRSRRHSPRRPPRRGARRARGMQPSGRGRRLVPWRRLPR